MEKVTPVEPISFAQAFDLINPQLREVEERIRAQAQAFDPAVEAYVSYVCGAGGKRLRPALALLAGGVTGEISPGHVDLAVIMEIIHVATLVHDDIMDGAEMRRDQPTANARWGNAITVLLGDCLFAHALRLATGFSDSAVCRRISDAAAEVCSGEIIQTQRRFDLKLSTAEYYRIIEMKTAALFSTACELGAYLNGAGEQEIAGLKDFGAKLGVAYQIYDDILDLAGTEEETGKTLGTDLRKGKFTLPVLLLLQSGRDEAALRDMLLGEEEVNITALLDMAGAIPAATEAAATLLFEADALLDVLPDSQYAGGLRAITAHLGGLLERFR